MELISLQGGFLPLSGQKEAHGCTCAWATCCWTMCLCKATVHTDYSGLTLLSSLLFQRSWFHQHKDVSYRDSCHSRSQAYFLLALNSTTFNHLLGGGTRNHPILWVTDCCCLGVKTIQSQVQINLYRGFCSFLPKEKLRQLIKVFKCYYYIGRWNGVRMCVQETGTWTWILALALAVCFE